jgi:acyl-CoA reductase-like NAD-dependent aldehyde dehydrogenase
LDIMTTGLTAAALDYVSRNPATGEIIRTYPGHDLAEVDDLLERSAVAWDYLRRQSVAARAAMLDRLGAHFEASTEEYARLITREMGKPIAQARQEIAKCAVTCVTMAQKGPEWLSPVSIGTEAAASGIQFDSLGPILAIMPWNFPFFQAVRFLAPAILAGNAIVLKHAENVPACAAALERAVAAACGHDGILVSLRISRSQVPAVIADARIRAVTLTGSVAAGRAVAAQAGAAGKKVVLELGGSDPFIVAQDADLEAAVPAALQARFANTGQSCICGKRFIVDRAVLDPFLDGFTRATAELTTGDPADPGTDLGPLARGDLRETLDRQVADTLALGARAVLPGGPAAGPGYFYRPVILAGIPPGSPAAVQELFGPVASIFTVDNDEEAVAMANETDFGLGCSVWTRDRARAAKYLDSVQAGMVFVNSVVKSDARLPFGGVKDSGFGREFGILGVREFTNAKTVWIA